MIKYIEIAKPIIQTTANAGFSNLKVSKSNFLNNVHPKMIAIIIKGNDNAFDLFILLIYLRCQLILPFVEFIFHFRGGQIALQPTQK